MTTIVTQNMVHDTMYFLGLLLRSALWAIPAMTMFIVARVIYFYIKIRRDKK